MEEYLKKMIRRFAASQKELHDTKLELFMTRRQFKLAAEENDELRTKLMIGEGDGNKI